ncbi:MAG: hypothetical protein LBT88_02330 [Oscillospiraceae bacterium]|jgi:hypothetical protein|nr:hypothetical protein [Oscillospiraceae bacterium]
MNGQEVNTGAEINTERAAYIDSFLGAEAVGDPNVDTGANGGVIIPPDDNNAGTDPVPNSDTEGRPEGEVIEDTDPQEPANAEMSADERHKQAADRRKREKEQAVLSTTELIRKIISEEQSKVTPTTPELVPNDDTPSDSWIARNAEKLGLYNAKTGEPIKTAAEYREFIGNANESKQLPEPSENAELSEIRAYIESEKKFRRLQDLQKQFSYAIDREVEEIRKIEPDVADFETLQTRYPDVLPYARERNLPLDVAFAKLNYGKARAVSVRSVTAELSAANTAQAKVTAANRKQIGGLNETGQNIDGADLAMYKLLDDRLTDEEIKRIIARKG